MPVLLDVMAEAQKAAQDPGTSTLGMVVTLVGGIAAIAKFVMWAAERARQKAYKAIGPVSPQEPPKPDPERDALLARVAKIEQESAARRELWKLQDVEAKYDQAVEEQNKLRNALIRARAVRDELKAMNEGLRADNAALRDDIERLRFELGAAVSVTEEEILIEDAADERIPTPLRPPPRAS